MKILFTLDYELFLGGRAGDVEECLINPLNLYLEGVEPLGVRFTLFVDAAYIYRLRQESDRHPQLQADYARVTDHLLQLQSRGHDIQLHIHPQWYYSTFDGSQWQIDSQHYKLSDIQVNDVKRWFQASKDLLDQIIGHKTRAFRAGGFSAQPTPLLAELFEENGLTLDSSVCPGAVYDSPCQKYDYRECPRVPLYSFDEDICVENPDGRFRELPITMHRVSPLFHWKLVAVKVWTRLMKSPRHKPLGNGLSVKATRDSIFRRLTRYYDTMATIDGFKVSFLLDSIQRNARQGHKVMCILGHPKLATPYSVAQLPKICNYALKQGHQFCTVTEIIDR